MLFFGITLLGIISYFRLPQELFPPINYPRLSIVTHYQNAAPEEIETLVTRPIEETIGAVNNLKGITSLSKEGTSIVTISFNWGTNMDFASLNVREKLDLIKDRFPRESDDPVVIKFNPFELPVLRFSVTGSMDQFQMRKACQRILKDGLEKVEGVASVSISGGLVREILVEVDQGRLQASGVSITTVVHSLDRTNLNYPAGNIQDNTYEYLIRTIGEYQSVKEIGFTPVSIDARKGTSDDKGPPQIDPQTPGERQTMSYKRKEQEITAARNEKRIIFLKEIAEIKDTYKKQTSYSRLMGKPDISITVQKQSGTNTLRVVDNVKKQLQELKKDLPAGMNIDMVYDQSEFIKKSIRGVTDSAWQGGLLAFVVILAFLRNFRSALIVTLSIPVSILATFIMMYFKGEIAGSMSLNMMSLGGLALAVGMLVDNAIVVIENIFRYREMGTDAKAAAVKGTGEVTSAIISSTLTTVAVFFPLIFVPGLAGQIFKDLAFTVCFGLVASLFVAVTLIPLLATAVNYRKKVKTEYSIDEIKRNLLFLKKGMRSPLVYILILVIAIIMFAGSAFLFSTLDVELLPKVDQGQFLIKVELPTGSKLDVTNATVEKIENYITNLPEVKSVAVSIGSDKESTADKSEISLLESYQGEILVNLREDRTIPTAQVIQNIKSSVSTMKLGQVNLQYILQESVFKSLLGTESPVVVQVSGYDLNELGKICDMIESRIKKVKGIYGIKSSKSLSSPETKVEILKDNAATYAISVDQIAVAAQTALKGSVATKFKEEGNEYDIRVQLREEDRKDFLKIRELLIHSDAIDVSVPLKQVAVISQGLGPSEIQRINQERTLLLTANIFGREFKDVTEDVHKVLSSLDIPEGYKVELTGEDKEIKESFKNLGYALLLSILLVYMIMASQFESFIQPLIIMFTVPLSIIGVALALYLSQTSISVDVMLGIIILGGIVVNNGIVLIEFIKSLRAEGYSPKEAAFIASKIRRRPIMMTALTTIIGLIPLALGFGEGSELRAPMAITVMGGLTTSTLLTLIVIPIIYYFVETFRLYVIRKFGGGAENGTTV